MKYLIASTLIAVVFVLGIQPCYAQVLAPTITAAKFDDEGKLVIRSQFSAIAGCYLALNGGLSRKSIRTGITSIQLNESQASRGTVTLRTKRRYYCRQRKLYINLELVCLNSVVGSATSDARAVSVPASSVRN